MGKKLSISIITFIFFLIVIFSTGFFTGIYTSNNLFVSKEPRELTEKQKIEDFEYMYDILKDNYAHFYEVKKMYNYDWLAHKEEFEEMIKNTKDDEEFYKALNIILSKLHDWHTYVLDPIFYHYTLRIANNYTTLKKENIQLGPFIDIFKKSEKAYRTWDKLFKENIPGYTSRTIVSTNNIKTEIVEENKIAYLRVNSFAIDVDKDFEKYKEDREKINNFLKNIKDYPYLIIDISGNGGGNTLYWVDAIVNPLLDKGNEVENKEYWKTYLIRNGAYVMNVMREYLPKDSLKPIEKLPNYNLISEGIKKEFKYYMEGRYNVKEMRERTKAYFNGQIEEKEPVGFKGKIFVIIDQNTFSAANSFAEFCKETGFATLVGIRTRGDGWPIGYMRLPNSGLIVSFEYGTILNEDGTTYFETGTVPDIEIEMAKFRSNDPDVKGELLKQKTVEIIKALENKEKNF
ncbi:S41 family peptidase [Caldanaerobacter subterraneus]|uniref:Tricorn protease-like protein n=1 Tax=Caldanaerobacter subterraneus TaxID=911092 RepID=A0A4R2JV08_9THEO|nr:S41 family peptidase [Caldanaerobacter subterraneus]TCO64233.1 tricorn protease-like protein [Caldanaerobacter subterraneus]